MKPLALGNAPFAARQEDPTTRWILDAIAKIELASNDFEEVADDELRSPALTFKANNLATEGPTLDLTVAQVLRATKRRYHAVEYGVTHDGTTNDTVALQAFLDAVAAAGGGIAKLDYGTVKINATIYIPSGVILEGAGHSPHWNSFIGTGTTQKQPTKIEWHGGTGGTMFRFGGSGASAVTHGAQIRNLNIDGKAVRPTATITGITKAANAVITTAAAHGFSTNNVISFSGIGGMTELNGRFGVITVLSATTFSVEIDSTSFTTYTSGGTATCQFTDAMVAAVRFAGAIECRAENIGICNVGYGYQMQPQQNPVVLLQVRNAIRNTTIMGCCHGLYFRGNGNDFTGSASANGTFENILIWGVEGRGGGFEFVQWCDNNTFTNVWVQTTGGCAAGIRVNSGDPTVANGCSVLTFDNAIVVDTVGYGTGGGTTIVNNTHGTLFTMRGNNIGRPPQFNYQYGARVFAPTRGMAPSVVDRLYVHGGAGAVVGTTAMTYTDFVSDGGVVLFNPDRYFDTTSEAYQGYDLLQRIKWLKTVIRKVEWVFHWVPGSASGGVVLVDPDSGESLYSGGFTPGTGGSPPYGAGGERIDVVDVTDAVLSTRGIAEITNITKAVNAVVTATSHGFSTGNTVVFSSVFGMTNINGLSGTVTVIDANTFSVNIDSRTFSTYFGGGIAYRASVAVGNWGYATWHKARLQTISDGVTAPRIHKMYLDVHWNGVG